MVFGCVEQLLNCDTTVQINKVSFESEFAWILYNIPWENENSTTLADKDTYQNLYPEPLPLQGIM